MTASERLPRTLDDWLDWQTRLHPQVMAFGLERAGAVWTRLGHAPWGPVATVGGTNGKGSGVALLEAMARAGGYRTLAYTSPHLLHYSERLRIDGQPVAESELCAAFARIETARDGIPLTYFEFGTLAALDLAARRRPELTILEVGLGGRLDAVNILDADVAMVTSIGYDHTAWLGDTLAAIAGEKAGIFRPGRPAVIGQRAAPPALRAAALARGSQPLQLGCEFDLEVRPDGWSWSGGAGTSGRHLTLPRPALHGPHQLENAAAAIAALDALRDRLPLPPAALRAGLERVGLPGRFQVLPGAPVWILDVAHNGAAAQALAASLRAFMASGGPRRMAAVLAVLADKDPEAIVAPLQPLIDRWWLSQSADARALPAAELDRRLAGQLPDEVRAVVADLDRALDAAQAASAPDAGLLVFGSFTTVAAALRQRGLDAAGASRGG